MSAIRELVYDTIRNDAQLNSLGVRTETVLLSGSVDSPAADFERWMTIRWGAAEPPVGRDAPPRPIAVSFWVYDREKDYAAITAILRRLRTLLDNLAGLRADSASAVIDVAWAFSSEDLYDSDYDAVLRSETYRLVASGV